MKKGVKILLGAFAAVLAAAGIWAAMNPVSTDAIWHNMTAFDKKMDTSEWTGGRELLHVPYAEDSESQYLDLYLPESEEKLPLFVLVHGGGFVFGDSQTRQVQWMYRYFREHGYACATVNYRLAQEAAWPASVEDAKAAVRFLRANADQYGYDADRIAIWGESAGGYIAAMAAITRDGEYEGVKYIGQTDESVSGQVRVLVDYYGAMDFGSMAPDYQAEGIAPWINKMVNSGLTVPEMKKAGFTRCEDFFIRAHTDELTAEELARFCPRSYIPALEPGDLKTIIAHGEIDITVPILQSKRLEAELTAQLGSEDVYALYPHDCKHADDKLYTDEFLSQIAAKMEEYLN